MCVYRNGITSDELTSREDEGKQTGAEQRNSNCRQGQEAAGDKIKSAHDDLNSGEE
ncbi:hypothetical protein [Bradyrhizobium canariense]|uniref:hypothetical protein n=1 Tax=Bradyrhizobium canariense TaxID=255045 RepID=UPI001302217A|nr:hypothetical protein [Bradyrhizobium canariense]